MEEPKNCREYFNCQETACPVYLQPETPCWLEAGTLCHQGVQNDVWDKVAVCPRCQFFQLRVDGEAKLDLLEAFKKITNPTLKSISREIYEHRRAEEALRETETQYRLIVNQIPEIVFRVYEDWGVDFFDHKIDSLTGYRKEDFDSRRLKWCDLIHPDDFERVKAAFVKALKTGLSYLDEYRLVTRAGDHLWVQVRGRIFCDLSGKIEYVSGIMHDITEQKKSRQALEKNAALLNSVFRAAPIGIGVTYNRVLDITNEYLAKMTGYSNVTLRGQSARLLYPSDAEYVRVGREKYAHISRQGVGAVETTWRRQDGQEIEVFLSSSPIDPLNLEAGVVFTALDITERQRAEAEAKLNEKRLEALLRLNQMTQAPLPEIAEFALEEGIRLTGSQIGYFALMSPDETVLTMYAWSKEAMRQCQIKDVTHTYPVQTTGLWGEAVRQRRAVITNDYAAPNPWKKGYPQGHVEVRRHMNVPVFDGERIVIVAGVGNKPSDYDDADVRQLTLLMTGLWRIIQRKQAEEALRGSEEKYRFLVSNFPAIAFTGYADGCVDFLDDKIEALTGYSSAEFNTRKVKWLDLVHPEDFPEVKAAVVKALKTTRTYVRDYRLKRRDGEIIWVQGRGKIFCRSDGRIAFISGVLFDITEGKREEELHRRMTAQLIQAQKMEAIGTLAGGIAHDFNNILSAIMGYTDLAALCLEEVPNSKSREARAYLNEAFLAEQRAKDLVSQILTFSRQTEQERQPVDICAHSQEVIKFLRASIPTTIAIISELNPRSGIVMADPVQIHQILMNLGTNAYHAMADTNGTIRISVEPLRVDAALAASVAGLQVGNYVRISVSDTGHGMDPLTLQKIFDPFFTTKQPGQGTGLGLSVVHGIVQDLGGTITVASEPGRGANFQVYLPRYHGAAPVEAEPGKPLWRGQGRVLLVDDEAQLVQLGERMLRHLGYEVAAFTSSKEALEFFRAQPETIDLVITDLTMPQLTGLELSRELLQIRVDLPIILTTGFSQESIWRQAKELGVRECLLKPAALRDLADTIKRARSKSTPGGKTQEGIEL